MAAIVRGKNICLTPSALIMGKMMPEALCEKRKISKIKLLCEVMYSRSNSVPEDGKNHIPRLS